MIVSACRNSNCLLATLLRLCLPLIGNWQWAIVPPNPHLMQACQLFDNREQRLRAILAVAGGLRGSK